MVVHPGLTRKVLHSLGLKMLTLSPVSRAQPALLIINLGLAPQALCCHLLRRFSAQACYLLRRLIDRLRRSNMFIAFNIPVYTAPLERTPMRA